MAGPDQHRRTRDFHGVNQVKGRNFNYIGFTNMLCLNVGRSIRAIAVNINQNRITSGTAGSKARQ